MSEIYNVKHILSVRSHLSLFFKTPLAEINPTKNDVLHQHNASGLKPCSSLTTFFIHVLIKTTTAHSTSPPDGLVLANTENLSVEQQHP